MVSASKAAREAKRAADGKAPSKKAAKSGTATPADVDPNESAADAATREKLEKLNMQEDEHGLSDRITTGVLASLATSQDVKILSASLVFHGKVLITDSTMEVTYGRRYGLLGENGCGKSTLLKAIDKREYPFPEAIDIYLLNEGAPKTELGALEWVVKQAELELERLEKQAEDILDRDGPESPILQDIYDVRWDV
jgi:ATP-binding cassette subfamily F protein 2